MMEHLAGKIAIVIIEDSKSDDGQYIPVAVKHGCEGYYPMSGKGECAAPWTWGKDREIALQCADDYNKKLGISPDEVDWLVTKSMFPASEMAIPGIHKIL